MIFYEKSVDDVLRNFDSSEKGLLSAEVDDRTKKYGRNVIDVKGESLWRKLTEPFRSIFIAVLGVAAVISIVTDHAVDAIIILIIISISAGIYYVQRYSTERVLRALKQHDFQSVDTYRDGVIVGISSEELLPGDVIILTEGQKIPADARVMHADNVRADEALLTGESQPVSKHVQVIQGDKEVYEQSNMLFQGAFIVSGEVTAVVVATGNNTEFGQIATLAGGAETSSPVQRKIDSLVTRIISVVAAVSLVTFALSMYRGIDLSESLRFMITLAVSAVPEGLPIAISVVLVLGMRRMAKYNALVRSMSAIENVGLVTTIATDKTGTLTKNKLSVQDTWQLTSPADLQNFAKHVFLTVNESKGNTHDPLDTALRLFAQEYKSVAPDDHKLITMLPFDQSYAMSGNVWAHNHGYDVIVKGAPEHVIDRSVLTTAQDAMVHKELHSLTGRGYRVIALARLKNIHEEIASLDDLPKKGLELLGLIAVADELRPEAAAAVTAAQRAGVSVRMITGDHFETAYAIGKQLGLAEHRDQVFDSRKMNDMSEKELESAIDRARVFSRVVPENKHKILTYLKKNNITAMTGDGVNDVPALANAHIGVAMGSGSQIAKETGDIVLLDDNFSSIISALREGRVIFDNIRRMLFYLLATTSGLVITMIGALVIGVPLPAVPVQILWINLVTDSAMVIPLGLEPAEEDVMKRKPRRPTQPILDRFLISRMVAIAAVMACTALGVFLYYLYQVDVDYARTITFNALVVMQWANAFNARSEQQSLFLRLRTMNWKFYVGLALGIALQAAALFGPLQDALHVVSVSLLDLAVTAGISAAVVIIAGELHKVVGRRYVYTKVG